MGILRILSTDEDQFQDREEAGTLLGETLAAMGERAPLVLGIPRGGLVVGRALADVMSAELDAVFTLKLRFPGSEEFAAGAVSEGGQVLLDGEFVEKLGLTALMEEEKEKRFAELARRTELVRSLRPRIPPKGRTVIVTDDGVATGSTMRASFRSVAAEGPRRLIGAVPVGDEGAVEKLAGEVDEMVCLRCPPSFLAVSQFYRKFPQVEDEEVLSVFRKQPGVK